MIRSNFMREFEIEYYDEDLAEAARVSESNLSLNKLVRELSYGESFAGQLPSNLDGNAAIALYEFAYDGRIVQSSNAKFIGVFEYKFLSTRLNLAFQGIITQNLKE